MDTFEALEASFPPLSEWDRLKTVIKLEKIYTQKQQQQRHSEPSKSAREARRREEKEAKENREEPKEPD